MKIRTFLILTLFWVSGPVSATLIDYTFSGNFDQRGGCFTATYCGAYSGVITIDDAQTGTAAGPDDDIYLYKYKNLKITLYDGTEITKTTGSMMVATTSPVQIVSAEVHNSDFLVQLFWQFADHTFVTSNINEVLAALTSAQHLSTYVISIQSMGNPQSECGLDSCPGSLTALTQSSVSKLADNQLKKCSELGKLIHAMAKTRDAGYLIAEVKSRVEVMPISEREKRLLLKYINVAWSNPSHSPYELSEAAISACLLDHVEQNTGQTRR